MDTTAIILLLASFFIMIILGFHISYAMMASAGITILYLGLSPTQIINTMVDSVDGFTFLAIPFFILSGDIMAHGGISDRLILLADALVGWMRGGLAMVNVMASIFFGGISGSATADTASLGAILIPMMHKQGYDKEFATAVTMTSSVQGMLIPPSHNMIIYAMAAGGISVSALFMAGIVPGVLLGLALMVFSYYLSVKRNYPKGTPFSVRHLLTALKKSIWGLGTVLIVVVGVVAGVFTATESAAIACVYALVVSMVVYREMSWRELLTVLKSSIKTLSTVLILISASGPFGFCITYLKIPTMVVNGLLGLTDSKFILLLLINLIILVLGTILGMASIIVIVTPILMPVLLSIGLSPIQFGAILILNCGIGLITPPVGGVLFIGSGISGVPIERLFRHTLPLIAVMLVVLLLITYIPAFTLALPGALGLL
ncbi:TRAP transporter large permease [Clostridium sp. AN503]|uniref:TRAP transporter large permease n=1 Tax=Clostridium sp. AN503 TaxID=3160598 RepID=UPI00345B04E9